jgi:hypothetical protein
MKKPWIKIKEDFQCNGCLTRKPLWLRDLWVKKILLFGEKQADGRGNAEFLARRAQFSGLWIDGENVQAIGVLARDDQECCARSYSKMPWSFDIGYGLSERGERSCGGIDAIASDRLVAAIGCVKESPVRVDFDFGSGVWFLVVGG